ncbi:flagellar motor switch protein FliM [Arenibaculum pallidiluteum]|uniref:flagellar motor switch protein FliM n=1 Tax=Arenibaculum pallidiluteum TaxID=2812559 RepID=UPI001A9644A3|nr:flagellar motor switch protein FliM [Arenibaculum pallidiluteum]
MSDPNVPDDEELDMAAAMGIDKQLNQAEIDNLLDFGDRPGQGGMQPGVDAIQRLVNSTTINKDRLPLLDIVFDRMVRLLNGSLRQLTSGNVEATLVRVDWVRFSEFLDTIELPALIGVARAEQWDNQILVSVNSSLIYCMMDVLLGGRRSRPGRVEGRAYTSVERKLTERLVKTILQDLTQSFAPLTKVDFLFDRLEVNPQFAAITRGTNAAIRVRIGIEVDGRHGHAELVIPYATLEPVRDKLVQMFMGEKFGRDAVWETHLRSELQRTRLDMIAVLHQMEVPLAEVLAWKKGTSLKLRISPDNQVILVSGETPLFAGRMGQRSENISVKIDTDLDTRGELIDGLLSH